MKSKTPNGEGGKVRLVYLLAASHSGSTLLSMLLGNHAGICTAGELKLTALGDLERYRCSCRRLIRECPFWNGVRDDMAAAGHLFDLAQPGTDFRSIDSRWVRRVLKPLHNAPPLELARDAALGLSGVWRREYPRVQARNVALIGAIAARSGKGIVVDSSKVGVRLKYLLRNDRIDIQVVRLIRDGRGVSLTYVDPANYADARNPGLRAGGSGGDRNAERKTIRAAATEWKRSNEEAEAVLAAVPSDRRTLVRYEELCASPSETLARLFRFLDVDPAGGGLDFRSRETHVVGNGMRLDDDAEIRLDERWRTALGPGELAEFDLVAGELNRRLGYT